MALIKVAIFAILILKVYSEYICTQSVHPDIIIKLPQNVNCKDSQYVETDITVKKINDDEYESNAVIVSAKVYKCTVHAVLNIFSNFKETFIDYITLSKNEILKMNETCHYKNEELKYNELSSKYILGVPTYECVSYLFSQHTTEKTYVTMQRVKMYYKSHLMHTELGTLPSCEYSSQFCKIFNDLYITWEVNENATKDYKYYQTKGYMLYDENNNTHISFIDNDTKTNVSVVIDDINNVDNDSFIQTSNFAYKIKFNKMLKDAYYRPITTYRTKRSYDSSDATDVLQYLYDISSENFNRIFQLCNEMSISIMELYALCAVSPKQCISVLINDTNINVNIVGNKYLINKCSSAKINKFLPSAEEYGCSLFPKVEILVQGSKISNCYYNTKTEQIFSSTKYTSNCNDITFVCLDDPDSLCIYNHFTGNVTSFKVDKIINLGFKNNIYIEPPTFNISSFISVPTLNDIAPFINTNIHVSKYVQKHGLRLSAILIIVILSVFSIAIIAIFAIKFLHLRFTRSS
ncbi:hypothetical protein MseVgp099 [Melanoplus sanguinipes entomopoxvirus]|uniref:Uncharacterized protein n=1 Tax=Melanoplus sanguinipes entomopoxvirus TaxID=83191 RepID=Q9YVZ3_MSEPV|nr:hypothetical protein MseVgp099 [Melanoplus sanguinipes entomopoxvirus]AAC97807.1 ORF MSV099 hypothetical protein [Melanoplus sanguinipes entomopoxvirus 'O']